MLSSPVELIRVQRHGNEFFRAAVADMQGWRNNHEDGHDIRCEAAMGSFWVLDGHGGDGCARFCSPKLGEEFAKGPLPDDAKIEQVMQQVDSAFAAHVKEYGEDNSGSTVVGCVVQRQAAGSYSVKLANCGDSRALIVRGPDSATNCSPLEVRLPLHLAALDSPNVAAAAGAEQPDYREPNKGSNPCFSCRWPIIAESVDHKPSHPTEKARIQSAGGYVTGDEPPRLDGNLAVSRCLGDFEYKKDKTRSVAEQKVSCIPDIYEVHDVPQGSFLVLACDGLWDVCSGEYIANCIREELQKNPKHDLGEIASFLIKRSIHERSSKDNVTLMIVHLTDGSDWAAVPDEMKGWEKLVSQEPQFEDDAKRQYGVFLDKCNFPDKPLPCSQCDKWVQEMSQCPGSGRIYCSRQCQKKGWKEHKAMCPALSGPGI
jgi:serine/threonine protein phosphatase PrpC